MQRSAVKPKNEEFRQRRDFYWQYIAVYAIILIIYSVLRGTLRHDTISVVITDPIVILLVAFIFTTTIGLLISYYKNKTIIIGNDFVIFKTRFREKKFTNKEIINILIGKEKLFKVRRGFFKVIKIVLDGKRRVIRIRPSTYERESEIIEAFSRLKKNINR